MENAINANSGKNVLIVGVGGQGTLLAGRVIGQLAAGAGYDVKVSEVHGMSQRGGSVATYVKFAGAVASPLIEPGEADVIIAFELLEAARWLPYLKPDGFIAANTQKIDPMPVITGETQYPEGLCEAVRARCPGAALMDALAVAEGCGSKRSVNLALLGAASGRIGFSREEWLSCIREVTPARAIDVNIKAFLEGARIGGG